MPGERLLRQRDRGPQLVLRVQHGRGFPLEDLHRLQRAAAPRGPRLPLRLAERRLQPLGAVPDLRLPRQRGRSHRQGPERQVRHLRVQHGDSLCDRDLQERQRHLQDPDQRGQGRDAGQPRHPHLSRQRELSLCGLGDLQSRQHGGLHRPDLLYLQPGGLPGRQQRHHLLRRLSGLRLSDHHLYRGAGRTGGPGRRGLQRGLSGRQGHQQLHPLGGVQRAQGLYQL